MMKTHHLACLGLVAFLILASPARAATGYRITVIADSRDFPGWSLLTDISLNDSGVVAWGMNHALGTNSVESALYTGNGTTTSLLRAETNKQAAFSSVAINKSGQVAFHYNPAGSPSIRVIDGSQVLTLLPGPSFANQFQGLADNTRIAQNRQAIGGLVILGQGGVAKSTGLAGMSAGSAPVISRDGENAALGGFRGSDWALVLLDARTGGQSRNLGPRTQLGLSGLSTNNLGRTAFVSENAPIELIGLVDARGSTSGYRTLVNTQDGRFATIGGAASSGGVAINNSNEVAFVAGPGSSDFNLYRSDTGGSTAAEVIVRGESIPGLSGVVFERVAAGGLDTHGFNDQGQIAFVATLSLNGQSFNAILRADPLAGMSPAQPIMPVVEPGGGGGSTPAPGGAKRFLPGMVTTPVGGRLRLAPPIKRFIDPDVAIGYVYTVDPDGPNFASVLIPAPLSNGDGSFQLQLPDGRVFDLQAGDDFNFAAVQPGGVASFRLSGIDTSEMLNPADPQAFVTGLSFMDGGVEDFGMTMTPITVSVPEPAPVLLFLLGGLLATARRFTPRYPAPLGSSQPPAPAHR